MVKKNKLLIGCLSLLLVLSVGYALFSETVTINGMATAKGSFDITASCSSGVDEAYTNYVTQNYTVGVSEGGTENGSCTVNGSTVSFGANLLYPSAQKFFTIRLKNTGTIDAKINANSDMIISYETCQDQNGDDVAEVCMSTQAYNFSDIYVVGFAKADGTKVPVDNEAVTEFANMDTGDIVISPNEEIVLFGVARWNESFDENGFNDILWKTTVSTTFNFTQASAQ